MLVMDVSSLILKKYILSIHYLRHLYAICIFNFSQTCLIFLISLIYKNILWYIKNSLTEAFITVKVRIINRKCRSGKKNKLEFLVYFFLPWQADLQKTITKITLPSSKPTPLIRESNFSYLWLSETSSETNTVLLISGQRCCFSISWRLHLT